MLEFGCYHRAPSPLHFPKPGGNFYSGNSADKSIRSAQRPSLPSLDETVTWLSPSLDWSDTGRTETTAMWHTQAGTSQHSSPFHRQADGAQGKRRLIALSTNARQLGTCAAVMGEASGFASPSPPGSLSQPVVLRSKAPPAVSLIQHHQPPVDRLEQLQGLALGVLCAVKRRGPELESSAQHGRPELWHSASVEPQVLWECSKCP